MCPCGLCDDCAQPYFADRVNWPWPLQSTPISHPSCYHSYSRKKIFFGIFSSFGLGERPIVVSLGGNAKTIFRLGCAVWMVGGLPALEEARRVLLASKRSIKRRRRTTHGGVPCDAPYFIWPVGFIAPWPLHSTPISLPSCYHSYSRKER